MFRLLPEREADTSEVEALFDLAFAPGRTALSSYRLREGTAPVATLCRIVRDEYDAVVGAVRVWPVRVVGARMWPALLLGPIAVHPIRQGEGLGGLLMRDCLARARALGWARMVLVGDADYYARFGFRRDLARALCYPPPVEPARVLALELLPGAMAGVQGTVQAWRVDNSR